MQNETLEALEREEGYDLVVVDDDTLFTTLLARRLRRSSKRYRIFRDGSEALAYLENASPSVLLTDLYMPRLNGVEMLEALDNGSRASPLNVIVCSSCLPLPDTREAIGSLGATLITKDELLKENALTDLLSNGQTLRVARPRSTCLRDCRP